MAPLVNNNDTMSLRPSLVQSLEEQKCKSFFVIHGLLLLLFCPNHNYLVLHFKIFE